MAACFGWSVRTEHGPIATEDERAQTTAALADEAALPEMLFARARLAVEHDATGARVEFSAVDALRAWKQEDAPPPDIPVASAWRASREGTDAFAAAAPARTFDWTFTTPYAGTANKLEFAATDAHRINREMLMARDPILFYDEVELYASELDDTGAVRYAVKVRVMPRCWFVLARLWLRVDDTLVRLREHRLFCSADAPDVVVRETTWHEGTREALAKVGAPSAIRGGASSPYADADATAQALNAVAPSAVVKHAVECAACV